MSIVGTDIYLKIDGKMFNPDSVLRVCKGINEILGVEYQITSSLTDTHLCFIIISQ